MNEGTGSAVHVGEKEKKVEEASRLNVAEWERKTHVMGKMLRKHDLGKRKNKQENRMKWKGKKREQKKKTTVIEKQK